MTNAQVSLIDILARQAVNEYLARQSSGQNSQTHRQPDAPKNNVFGHSDQIGSLPAHRIGHTVAA